MTLFRIVSLGTLGFPVVFSPLPGPGAIANDAAGFQPAGLSPQQVEISRDVSGSGCFSTFRLGGNDMLCISRHGNIASWSSYGQPSHFETEGYTVCDLHTAGTYYQDFHGLLEFGWDSPVVSQPNGRNTFPLKIQRDTTDGMWQLTQTYARRARTVELTVTMRVTNLTGAPRDVRLLRRADLRMNGSSSSTAVRYDRTGDAIWVRAESGTAAMTLRGIAGTYSTHLRAGDLASGTDCDPGNDPVPGSGFDVFTWVNFPSATVKPGGSITRTVVYSRM
jgi:hypothetical protein